MTSASHGSAGWDAPAECTLPTTERPLRVAEFNDLFSPAVRSVTRQTALHATFELLSAPEIAATAADLTAREAQCCTFWDFTLTMPGGRVMLDVRVSAQHREVLDALVGRAQALRYYERRGLLEEPARTNGGHRVYPAEAVTLLRVIKTAQRLGFTLAEVADLLAAGTHRHGRPDAGLASRAETKLAEIEQEITDLTTIRDSLRQAVDAGCDDLPECAGSRGCPLPFTALVPPPAPGGPPGSCRPR